VETEELDQGVPGLEGEPSGGVAYVRWGHNSCPSTGAKLVYSGRASRSNRIITKKVAETRSVYHLILTIL